LAAPSCWQLDHPVIRKYEKLRDVAGVISQESFWDELSSFLELMVPTIESSLVLQGGDSILGQVMYCFGRQYQVLNSQNEITAEAALESRF
jgi:hypothetical protein